MGETAAILDLDQVYGEAAWKNVSGTIMDGIPQKKVRLLFLTDTHLGAVGSFDCNCLCDLQSFLLFIVRSLKSWKVPISLIGNLYFKSSGLKGGRRVSYWEDRAVS